MNQLVIVSILVAMIVVGMFFFVGAAANPTGKIVDSSINTNETSLKLPPIVNGKQDLFLKSTEYGVYDPTHMIVKVGVPVRIHYSADEYAGCGREVIFDEFKVRKLAPSQGEALIEFTPTKVGKFSYRCPMNMFRGVIEVVQ
ncbi:MAG: cupredoxin domain-containing protein [archaeon]